jgi:nitrogen regulatory protein P-II 1
VAAVGREGEAMVKLECIIRPERYEDVRAALDDCGMTGLTVTEVRGCGAQRGYQIRDREPEYALRLQPKMKLEVVLHAERLEEAIQAVLAAAATGEPGDGKLFVIPVADAVRIRTGDRGKRAI